MCVDWFSQWIQTFPHSFRVSCFFVLCADLVWHPLVSRCFTLPTWTPYLSVISTFHRWRLRVISSEQSIICTSPYGKVTRTGTLATSTESIFSNNDTSTLWSSYFHFTCAMPDRSLTPNGILASSSGNKLIRGWNAMIAQPGAPGRIPATSVRNSYIGALPHAWQSERCETLSSTHVVRPCESCARQGS